MIRSALVFLTMVGAAWAGPTLTFTLDTSGCSGAGCAGGPPYGTVTLTGGSGVVNVNVALNSGINFVGNPPTFGFNLSGNPTIAVSSLTSGWSLVSTTAGSIHFSSFGNFEYAVSCDICGSGASNPQPGPLSFNVSASGLDTTSFQETSTGGTAAWFSADVQGTNGGTGNVGSVGSPKQTPPVPEPSSVLLLGTTAVGFLFMLWSRKRSLNSKA
jgi:hypothetical protein